MTTDDLTPDEELRLRTQVAALPDSVEPAHDLWPAIHGRIEAARVSALPATRIDGTPVRRRMPWIRLAAAAAVLVVTSATLTWLAVVPREPRLPTLAIPTGDVPTTASPSSLATFASYERSAADLASALERRTERLDPATRAVLERSLRTIDEAIAEARAALAADPASGAYQAFVESAYRQKIDFLRRANDIAALQGP
jgi:hypothetical protein